MKTLEMMDEIIKDMESKTPEELFECLYNGSEHFKRSWDKFSGNKPLLSSEEACEIVDKLENK